MSKDSCRIPNLYDWSRLNAKALDEAEKTLRNLPMFGSQDVEANEIVADLI